MITPRQLLVLDPTAFPGGSKVATENILRCVDSDLLQIIVLSADSHSWKWSGLKRTQLHEPAWLAQQEQGIAYFIRHFIILLNILWLRLRFGHFDMALGASGPGVDLALYLARPLLNWKVVQLVHGPVACSRTIGRCLKQADQVHYLPSSRSSLLQAIAAVMGTDNSLLALESRQFQPLHNGLPADAWPTPCQTSQPIVYWAASLLKWKGLDHLLGALSSIPPAQRPETHICYIRPKDTRLPVSLGPIDLHNVQWHEQPANLDAIRANANIFVSTSEAEPFGLSILEAMAAGHCILIPRDGAYWDQMLSDGHHCIKYHPGNALDLRNKLQSVCRDRDQRNQLGRSARKIAETYRAEISYANIAQVLQGESDHKTSLCEQVTPARG